MIIRVGLPKRNGAITKTAAAHGLPVMFSANAFRGANGFVQPSPLIRRMDAALDSAGFVAMARYGGFPWSPRDYAELAAAAPWAWWASMDFCCEPEIARDRDQVARRIERTAQFYGELRILAAELDIAPPVPVLQGWLPDDYRHCADLLGGLPQLVGIGSICRRDTGGAVAIVEAISGHISPTTRFHLFGVKGEAAAALAGHGRVASIDSMAWDFDARYSEGRSTNAKRIAAMLQWQATLANRLRQAPAARQLAMSI